jgi:hypothetical protein
VTVALLKRDKIFFSVTNFAMALQSVSQRFKAFSPFLSVLKAFYSLKTLLNG